MFLQETAETPTSGEKESLPVGERGEFPSYRKNLEGRLEDLFSEGGRKRGPRESAEDRIDFIDTPLPAEIGHPGDAILDDFDVGTTAAGDRGEGRVALDRPS